MNCFNTVDSNSYSLLLYLLMYQLYFYIALYIAYLGLMLGLGLGLSLGLGFYIYIFYLDTTPLQRGQPLSG
jgi:hypothetical protein